MSRNLYKAGWVTVESDARVIDTNELIEEKLRNQTVREMPYLEPVREVDEDGFSAGLDADTVEALVADESDVEAAVLKSAAIEEQEALNAQLAQARAEIESLQAQAEVILENAKAQAGEERGVIFEQAREQGYQEGYAQGMAQAEELKSEYQARKQQLEEEYQAEIEELEPAFVEHITEIYEHIFKVDLSSYRELVFSLLADAMQKAQDSRSYIVHVCRESYAMLLERKEELLEVTGTPADRLEIISDMTLAPGGCMIETESGVYDCSLETELEELKRRLQLLSYNKN